MLDNMQLLDALRTQLLSTVVATTGVTTLTATEAGFSRATGSFVTDGFVPGMEVTPSGFTNNAPVLIRSVAALTLTTDARTAEAGGAGRSLVVGIPALSAWENVEAQRQSRRWFIDEDYIAGPVLRATSGPLAELEVYPTYILRLEGVANTGVSAIYKVADAILAKFPPTLALTLTNGDIIYVRDDPAPERGQVMNDTPGTVVVVITIPLIGRTRNTI